MYLALFTFLVIADQMSKVLVQRHLPFGEPQLVLRPWLYFTYVENEGAAFSILSGHRWFFITMTVVFALAMWFWRATIARQKPVVQWGLLVASAGAFGNLIDRLRQGSVIDFIDLRFFPVFNIADCCLVVGFALVIISQLKGPQA